MCNLKIDFLLQKNKYENTLKENLKNFLTTSNSFEIRLFVN